MHSQCFDQSHLPFNEIAPNQEPLTEMMLLDGTNIYNTAFEPVDRRSESGSSRSCSPELSLPGENVRSSSLDIEVGSGLLQTSYLDGPGFNSTSPQLCQCTRNEPLPELEPPSALQRKRGHKRPAPDDVLDGDPRQSPSLRQSPQDTFDHGSQFLACPFYKKDSCKYSNCRTNVLRRIKDVKQHIFRKHKKPDFYCPVCFKTFEEATLRDEHIQLRNCVGRSDPMYDGISEDQRKSLSQPSRGKTIEDKWCDTWRVIFPDTKPPKSPYFGTYQEETVSLCRDFWNEKRSKIISKILEMQEMSKLDHDLVVQLVESVFDQLEIAYSSGAPTTDIYHHIGPEFDNMTVPNFTHDIIYSNLQGPWKLPFPDYNWMGAIHGGDNCALSDSTFYGDYVTPFFHTIEPELLLPINANSDLVWLSGSQ